MRGPFALRRALEAYAIGGQEQRAATAAGRARALFFLGLIFSVSCVVTKAGMITPNEHSKSVGEATMSADIDECWEHARSERTRLRVELVSADPELGERARSEASREAAGRTTAGVFTDPDASTAERDLYGAAGAATWDLLFSEYDPDTDDEDMLNKYLQNFSCTQRLAYICLRAKGYRVKKREKDGSGTAYLERDPARVVLREEDGSEVLFYGYLPPSRR